MHRRLFAGLLGVAVAAAVGLPTAAQEKKDPPKKEQPKKKERIAIADPAKAKEDPDFAVQGEYAGDVTTKDGRVVKFGAQVVAKGEAKFGFKLYSGGLPGAGWDGQSVTPGEMVTLRGGGPGKKDPNQKLWGDIADGKFAFGDSAGVKGALTKVERKSPTLGAKPPAGAVVLFGGPGDEKNWTKGKLMDLSDGTFLTVAGTGSIKSKQAFGAFKAHIEFRTPWMPTSSGQGRGNSGIFIQDRYECQVLDSFGLKGENDECGGIYKQHKPLVNMCLPPLAWQTYDIEFTPAEFDADGKKTKNARTTILHNGVKIHDNVEHPKECPAGQKETAKPGPFQFQDHGDPVVYNNIWVVEVK